MMMEMQIKREVDEKKGNGKSILENKMRVEDEERALNRRRGQDQGQEEG